MHLKKKKIVKLKNSKTLKKKSQIFDILEQKLNELKSKL